MERTPENHLPLRRVIPGKSMDQENMAGVSIGADYANMTSQAFAHGYAQGYDRGHQDGHKDGWVQRDSQACSCTPEPEGAYCATPGCDCDCGFAHPEKEIADEDSK